MLVFICRYTFVDILRAILLSLEAMIEDPELQVNGFVLTIDWSNFTFKQASKLTPSMLRLAIEGLQVTLLSVFNLMFIRKSMDITMHSCTFMHLNTCSWTQWNIKYVMFIKCASGLNNENCIGKFCLCEAEQVLVEKSLSRQTFAILFDSNMNGSWPKDLMQGNTICIEIKNEFNLLNLRHIYKKKK